MRTPLESGRTAAESADLYAALLDTLNIKKVICHGVSGGGPSSYQFAIRHPDKCAALIASCAISGEFDPGHPAWLIKLIMTSTTFSRFSDYSATKNPFSFIHD